MNCFFNDGPFDGSHCPFQQVVWVKRLLAHAIVLNFLNDLWLQKRVLVVNSLAIPRNRTVSFVLGWVDLKLVGQELLADSANWGLELILVLLIAILANHLVIGAILIVYHALLITHLA